MLIFTGREKFNITTSSAVKFVLEADGTEVDSTFFTTLENHTIIILLREDEQWEGNILFSKKKPLETIFSKDLLRPRKCWCHI